MFGLDFTKNQKLALCVLIGVAILGLVYGYAKNRATSEIVISEPSNGTNARVVTSGSDQMVPTDPTQVICHVAGAVRFPNVYTLPAGKRVLDAINTAGGALPNADLQSLNLAAKIEDGSKIFVPMAQQPGMAPNTSSTPSQVAMQAIRTSGGGSGSSSSSSGEKFKSPGEGVVHINSAQADELQRLPGVGPSTAQKIVDYRSQIGSFANAEQLMDVKGIGPKKYEKMRPFVAL